MLILNVMPETHLKKVRMGPGKLLCLDSSENNFAWATRFIGKRWEWRPLKHLIFLRDWSQQLLAMCNDRNKQHKSCISHSQAEMSWVKRTVLWRIWLRVLRNIIKQSSLKQTAFVLFFYVYTAIHRLKSGLLRHQRKKNPSQLVLFHLSTAERVCHSEPWINKGPQGPRDAFSSQHLWLLHI